MGPTLKCGAPLLAAAATAAAILVAPIASAAPATGAGSSTTSGGDSQQTCLALGSTQSQCESPGNAQIYDAPPQVDYFPYAGGAT